MLTTATVLLAFILGSPPLPGVNTQGLNPQEVEALSGLLSDAICPCSPQETVVQCIQKKTCPEANQLADYGAEQFRQGLSIEQVLESVVRHYMEKYVRYQFDVETAPRKGAPNPKITIVEFADFECPHCAQMSDILRDIMKLYPADVAVVFKQFPLPHHTYASGAARAALAAHRQGKFWPMHDLIFQNQGRLSNERFGEFAKEIGLNLERFKQDMNDPTVYARIEQDRQEAIKANIQGTPAVYVNGRVFLDGINKERLIEMIQRLLKDKKK